MKYKSAYTNFSYIVFIALGAPLSALTYIFITEPNERKEASIIGSFILVLTCFIIHAFKNAFYQIENTILKYKCGVFHGKIDIQKIKKIEINNSIFVQAIFKLGWSHKGIIITYNNYDDLFISPENRNEFIAHLKEINPEIRIQEK